MKITILLGNGFDLGFGLETSYCDFYQYLSKKSENDKEIKENSIFKQIGSAMQNNCIELWVDYELALSKYTELLTEQDKEKFITDKQQMDRFLITYLIGVNEELNDRNINFNDVLRDSISKIGKCCREEDIVLLDKLFNKFDHSTIEIDAISFNYTDTVSLLFKEGNLSPNTTILGYPKNGSLIKVNKPFYLHGTLFNEEMIIGVNDKTQIQNKLYSEDHDINQLLVKSNLLKQSGQRHENKFQYMINSSNIICLYGLSIGATDSNYWEIVKNRLLGADIYLIIYAYDPTMKIDNIYLKTQARERYKNQFYEYSNSTQEEIKKIENKIIVELNSTIFEYKNK